MREKCGEILTKEKERFEIALTSDTESEYLIMLGAWVLVAT